MPSKRTIYGIILIIICILELFSPFGENIVFNILYEYRNGKIYAVLMLVIFCVIPLIAIIISLIWQIKSGKELRCFKKIFFFALFSQLYVVSIAEYNIIFFILYLILMIAFHTESIFLEEVRLTWQSFYRRRIPILVGTIILAGVIAFPFAKYKYYERSPYYYRLDSDGYVPVNWQTKYIITGADILQQVDSYYYCDYFENYKIGWVFKAKKGGVTEIVLQTNCQSGDIEKKIYTIHVDKDKRIEVTGVREVRIEK